MNARLAPAAVLATLLSLSGACDQRDAKPTNPQPGPSAGQAQTGGEPDHTEEASTTVLGSRPAATKKANKGEPRRPEAPLIDKDVPLDKALGTPAEKTETGDPIAIAEGKLGTVLTDPGDIPRLKITDEKTGEKFDLPLERTDVTADVTGFVARVEVVQRYKNPFSYPIEAIYVFPLPENSAVDAMKMVIGERVIEAEIKKREEARRTYEEAKKQGHTAALLEQERPNVFTQSVANIAPGSSIEVVVRYVQDLSYDAGEYEFVFPMVVGPRFNPGNPTGKSGSGTHPDTDEVPDASRISPPVVGGGMRSGHDIALTLSLDPALPVVDFDTPTHAVKVVEADGSLTVTLDDKDRIPNRDFIFRYRVDKALPQAAVMAHRDKRDGFFSLVLQPPKVDIDEKVGKRELVFVVDVSGSMYGTPLALCKTAIQDALQRMRPVDTFNVLTFAGRTARAFKHAKPANHTNIREALQFVSGARAGGGTMLGDAVRDALSPDVEAGRHRYVFFLTDGYVGNEQAIFSGASQLVDTLKQRGQKARVFGMGTGSSVNRHLMDGLAKAGNGTTIYVTNREQPTRAIDKFYRLIDHPVMTDVAIDWGGLDVKDIQPVQIPDLFASRPVILHGRYGKPGTGTIHIRGQRGGKRFEIPVTVELPERQKEHAALETLWARERIASLERDLWHQQSQQTIDAITQLGLDYRIVTAWTSFVAVDRSTTVKGDSKTIVQPVDSPEGVNAEMAGAGVVGARPVRRRMKRQMGMIGGKKGFSFSGNGVGGGGSGRAAPKLAAEAPEPAPSEDAPRPVTKPRVVKGNVSLGGARAQGMMDKSAIQRVIRRRASAMRHAYESALKRNPKLSGKIVLEWVIGAKGQVVSVSIKSDTVGDKAFVKALVNIIKRMRFPAPQGGGIVKVSYPFVFSPR